MPDTLVVVTSSFPIRADGSEAAGSFVADLVTELATHVAVRVVAPGPHAAHERWAERVEVVRYAAPSRPLSTLKPWRPVDLIWASRVLRGGLAATHRAVAAGGTSHVLALWGLPCGEWARRAAHRAGIGYSVWLLGSDVWTLGRIPGLRAALARAIRGADHAYADGYRLAEDAKGIAHAPISFLPSTRRIDSTPADPPRAAPPYRLLFLGRWHPNKGIDLLLDALSLLTEDDWRRIERVEIQGGGPMEQLVRERVATLQARSRPVVAGRFLTKPEAEAAILRADWLVIPSRIESIPVVFSDAMKLGRPVVATPVGDLPRLLADQPCGVLASGAAAGSLAAALRTSTAGSPQTFARGVSVYAAQFDIDRIAGRLCAEVIDRG